MSRKSTLKVSAPKTYPSLGAIFKDNEEIFQAYEALQYDTPALYAKLDQLSQVANADQLNMQQKQGQQNEGPKRLEVNAERDANDYDDVRIYW